MNPQFESVLFQEYPQVYEYADGDYMGHGDGGPAPIAVDGIACEDGWFRLVNELSASIERYNERVKETAHIVAVKEKFGGLRVNTDILPDRIEATVKFAEKVSQRVCERCGEMESAQPHTKQGCRKTLCEPCALDWKGVGEEIEIWQFPIDCHECGEETLVVYPRGVGGEHGGSWVSVGEELSDRAYCSVEQVYSSVQKQFVWGNTCLSCGAYQGNYYVYEAANGYVDSVGDWLPTQQFDCIDELTRKK